MMADQARRVGVRSRWDGWGLWEADVAVPVGGASGGRGLMVAEPAPAGPSAGSGAWQVRGALLVGAWGLGAVGWAVRTWGLGGEGLGDGFADVLGYVA